MHFLLVQAPNFTAIDVWLSQLLPARMLGSWGQTVQSMGPLHRPCLALDSPWLSCPVLREILR